MDERDREIRKRTYQLFVELGRAPTPDEVGPGTQEAWQRLHEAHALVLDELHVDGRVDTSCPDCGERLMIHIRNERPDDDTLLFHCLVPAVHWWDDIVFT